MKFGDISIGDVYSTNPVTVTKESILEFGQKYDPQYFHTDEAAAKESLYGSLIASGFQTLAVVWAEWIEMDILGRDCVGGAGADMQFKAPVIPNDQLKGQFKVGNKRMLSDEKRGILTIEVIIYNQEEEEVLSAQTNVFVLV
ncbi:MaoC/PaaZ C-terminal domain-containing protein [Virgibacillus sp. L01]|uniref:MaoC/PaaZ C-terminal domain-containing protein n=1 Tax=Virgibacillus sp. L01 TaxID=3457429 RepID=UPI003FCF11FD